MRPEHGADQQILCFGEFLLNRQLRYLRRGDRELKLSAKPFATLEFLVQNRHRVVPKSELLREVWGAQVEINTVEQAVRKIRQVLEDEHGEPRYIKTIPGQGYQFMAEVGIPEPPATVLEGNHRYPTRRRLLIAAGAGAPLAYLAGFTALRRIHRPEHVARAAVNGNAVAAFDSAGAVLWTHEFEGRLRDEPDEQMRRIQVAELDGDGAQEVLVTAPNGSDYLSTGEQLCCLSNQGKALWRYRPHIDTEFGTPGLNGPWKFTDVLVVPGRRSSSIWAAVCHTVWWPSFAVRLSAAGSATAEFINPGNIRALTRVETKSGSYIAAAGVNNGYGRAFVALLAEDGPPAVAPEAPQERYQCVRGCPAGRPFRYILLPQSELSTATRPYSIATYVFSRPEGMVVRTAEVNIPPYPGAYYYFSSDLRPQRVSYGDGYRQAHEQLEKEGRVRHRLKDCPEPKSALIEVCDEHGIWSKVEIPRVPSTN